MEDYNRMDIIALKRLYIEKSKELYQQILAGMGWREVEEQKRLVTHLSIELDKRLNRDTSTGHPAETPNRKES